MVRELLLAPHVALDLGFVEILRVFGHAVVGEMHEPVIYVVDVEIFGRKPYVALLVDPNFRRVSILHQHPEPDIKFSGFYYEGVLDVLLHHVLGLLPHDEVHNLLEICEAFNSSSAR